MVIVTYHILIMIYSHWIESSVQKLIKIMCFAFALQGIIDKGKNGYGNELLEVYGVSFRYLCVSLLINVIL